MKDFPRAVIIQDLLMMLYRYFSLRFGISVETLVDKHEMLIDEGRGRNSGYKRPKEASASR